ncbi:Phosphorylase b kinase regulatory subunit [Aphelenchoides bicaudatus]|nr:Phosphorylase b kinase regulatory subunit [Aphelenchoides bicaudatus]
MTTHRNKRLRRLTQAYLSPIQCEQAQVSQSHLSKVDRIYEFVEKFIVDQQSATTGLFPRYSSDKSIGYVKDSIYCALACWACSAAYQRLDDDRGRQTELRQTAVKTMRGILFSWMQQIGKLNSFKSNNSPEFALHARFDLQTGLEIQSTTFGNLQMDLVGLYLLVLVQLTTGGVQVVFTMNEVAFVQNLVFYIERTYRTPDFGMWERGSRYNCGEPELHASSLGIVKAALEAINGLNLFIQWGTSASVIYVDIDGHNRNRTTFETILPRESHSKNTDAALLIAIGWPAFGTHDEKLYENTLNKCVRHLEGRFGLRRFLRDGYNCECEETTKPYYTKEETFKFKSVECQFPAFLLYIVLTAYFKGNESLAERYWEKLQSLLVPSEYCGPPVVPECYCIEMDHMQEEQESPNSQDFYAINPSEFGVHLWSNSLYVIALLLREKLIHLSDIDPSYRHLPASLRPKVAHRYTSFEGRMLGDPVVQIALISESAQLQAMLATYGISSQTPHEVEPVQIWPSWRMVKVFESLGKDKRLALSGRPARPFGPLSTSKIYRVRGETVICFPLTFELTDFYSNADPSTLIEDIKRDIEFIACRWKLSGHPTFLMVLREENVVGEYFEQILDLLVGMKNGFVNRTRVRIRSNTPAFEYSLRTLPLEEESSQIDELPYRSMDDHELFSIISKADPDHLKETAIAIAVMIKRYGGDFIVQKETLHAQLEKIYRAACQLRFWSLVRYCAVYLRKTVTSLAPSITSLLVRGKQVIIGMKSCVQITINTPQTPNELSSALFNSCRSDSEPQAAVFQQELIISCADLIVQNASAFDGVLTIRLEWLTRALQLLLDYVKEHGISAQEMANFLNCGCPTSVVKQLSKMKAISVYDLPPTIVKELLAILITRKNWHLLNRLQVKRLNGALNRAPINFYDRIWNILQRTKGGIIIAGHHLPQEPTLSIMTQNELTFSYHMEAMMSDVPTPEHRQLIVELLTIVSTLMERNPEILFADSLNCDKLVERAFALYRQQKNLPASTSIDNFYEMNEDVEPSTFMLQAVVEKLLTKCDLKANIASNEDAIGELILRRRRSDEFCPIS